MAIDDRLTVPPRRGSLSRSASLTVSALLVAVGFLVACGSFLLSVAAGLGPDNAYPGWRIRPLLVAGLAVLVVGGIAVLVLLSRSRGDRARRVVTGAAVAVCVALLVLASVLVRLRWHLSHTLLTALRALPPPAGVTVVQPPSLTSPDQPAGPDDSLREFAYATWRIGGGDTCAGLTAALGSRPGWRRDPSGSCLWKHEAGLVRLSAFPAGPNEGAAPGTVHVRAGANDS